MKMEISIIKIANLESRPWKIKGKKRWFFKIQIKGGTEKWSTLASEKNSS